MERITVANLEADLKKSFSALRKGAPNVVKTRAVVEKALTDGEAHYGINTGFGALKNKRIETAQLEKLQENLLLSHAVGVGAPVTKEISRLVLQLKVHALGLGCSGVSESTFERLLRFVELDLVPIIPSQGSLGASGDLAPLSHMSLPLIGQGEFWNESGNGAVPAGELLKKHKLEPIKLKAKDGLALINGTQFMTAHGAYVLRRALHLKKAADILAAISLEALQGSLKPFDARIQEIRPHPGQIEVAANVRKLMAKSEILESHKNCSKVQDPYSLRCVPQVHGAVRDALSYAARVIEIEMNSVSDNPLVFDNGDILSGGNFHGEPLALALDFAAIALSELASISERRTYLLLSGHDGLPVLLIKDAGINSGFMIPQYTAAALVSENKVLSHPASVDSIPTSLGQEDHVSMGGTAATKLLRVFENVENVLAIELITSAQGLDYRAPLKAGVGVQAAQDFIRGSIKHIETDGLFGPSLNSAREMLATGTLVNAVEKVTGALS